MQEWEELVNAKEEGISEGKKEGVAATLVKNIEAVMQNFYVDLEQACISLNTTVEEYQKAKELVRV